MRRVLSYKYFWIALTPLFLASGFMFAYFASNSTSVEPAVLQGEEIAYDTGCATWVHESQIERCFYLLKVLKRDGVDASLKVFAGLYNADRDFEISNCHIYTHSIGRAAFREFGEGALSIDMFSAMPVMTARCAIKVYHGFFQEFLMDIAMNKGAPEKAREYCRGLERKSLSIERDYLRDEILGHCILGAGYGILYSYAEHGYKDKEAVSAALADCEIWETEFYTSCASGVYEGASMMYLGRASDDISWVPPKDPFFLCRGQAEYGLERICFLLLRSFAWTMMLDLRKVSELMEGSEESISHMMIKAFSLGAASFYIRVEDSNNEEMLSECRKLEGGFQKTCIGAIAYRVAKFRGGEDAVAFCRQESISSNEADYCFLEIVDSFDKNYTKEDRYTMCPLLETPYQVGCISR